MVVVVNSAVTWHVLRTTCGFNFASDDESFYIYIHSSFVFVLIDSCLFQVDIPRFIFVCVCVCVCVCVFVWWIWSVFPPAMANMPGKKRCGTHFVNIWCLRDLLWKYCVCHWLKVNKYEDYPHDITRSEFPFSGGLVVGKWLCWSSPALTFRGTFPLLSMDYL